MNSLRSRNLFTHKNIYVSVWNAMNKRSYHALQVNKKNNNRNFVANLSCRENLLQRSSGFDHSYMNSRNKLTDHFSPYEDFPLLTDNVDFSEFNSLFHIMFGNMKVFVVAFFNIRQVIDPDFKIMDMLQGSRHVFKVVSNFIASNEIDDLERYLTPDAFHRVKVNIHKYSDSMREELNFRTEDIYNMMIKDIVVQENPENSAERIVDVYSSFFCIKNFGEIMKNLKLTDIGDGHIQTYQGWLKLTRTYNLETKFKSDWIVSGIHYRKRFLRTANKFGHA